MTRGLFRGWRIGLVSLALAAMLGMTDGALAQQGVTKDEILIGGFGPVTGPLGFIGAGARSGMELAISEINAHGGVNGRKLKLIFETSGNSPAEYLAAAKKLVEQNNVFFLMIASGSTGAAAAGDYIREKGIVSYNTIAATPKIHDPLTKNVFHGTSFHAKLFTQADVELLMSFKPTPKKIAVLVETIGYHKAVFAGLRPLLEKSGAELAAVQEFDADDRDFTAQLLAIKKADPDVAMVQGDAAPAAFIIKQAAELGMADLKWAVATSAITDQFIAVGGKAVEGVRASWMFRYYHGESAEPMQKFEANWKKLNPNAPPGRPNYNDLAGYNAMYSVALALKAAGDNPTWESVIKSFESLKDATPSKFGAWAADLQAPETFSPTDHQGNDRMQEVVVKNGKWQVNQDRTLVFPNSGQF